jgi:hypothetical protein
MKEPHATKDAQAIVGICVVIIVPHVLRCFWALGVFFADRACVAYLTAAVVIDRTSAHSMAKLVLECRTAWLALTRTATPPRRRCSVPAMLLRRAREMQR